MVVRWNDIADRDGWIQFQPIRDRGWVEQPQTSVVSLPQECRACETALDILCLRDSPRSLHTNDESERILNYVRLFQHTLCADQRDLIYALFSIAEGRTALLSDYNLSADEAYTDFASKLVEQGALGILLRLASYQRASADQRNQPRPSAGLPSWVPDFRISIPSIDRNPRNDAISRTRMDIVAERIGDRRVSVSSKRVITVRARVGKISRRRLERRRFSASIPSLDGFREGDYACEIPYEPEWSSGFILRPMLRSRNCFTLAGARADHDDLEQGDAISGLVQETRIETISLF